MNTSILYEYNPWWINPDSIDDDRNIKSARMDLPLKNILSTTIIYSVLAP